MSEAIRHQEKCYCELVLRLLGPPIIFRSEILSNKFKNEAGRWLAKGQKSGSCDLSMIYRVHNKLRVPTQLMNILSAQSHNNLSFNLNFNMYVWGVETDSADESLNFKR